MGLTAADLEGRQVDAITCRDARLLLVGGPGSGKTLVALLIARRIVEEDTAGRRVLFLTFSRAATSELSSRAPGVFAGTIGERIEVTTFHSYAVGVLDAFRRFAGGPDEPVTIATREEVQLGVAAMGSVEFDDVVPGVLQLFQDAPWVLDLQRDRLAAVICDEFQDTRDEAFALLEILAEGRPLICLGDPDQMIFDGLPGSESIAERIDRYLATGPTVIDLGPASHRDPSQVIPRAAAALRDRRFDAPELEAAINGDRVRVNRVAGSTRDYALDQVKAALAGGAGSVGVFFSTNRQVNEFADVLRGEGLEHDVAGLSHASGEAELATATLAKFTVGLADWDEVLRRLGVFLASTTRGAPPLVARQLVAGDNALDTVLAGLLRAERDGFTAAAGGQVGELLSDARGMWPRVIYGGERLWELGLDDLLSESLGITGLPLDESTATELFAIASRRRTMSAIDTLPGVEAPIKIMNIYQIKGRQMDVSLTVRQPNDREPQSAGEALRLGRLIFVAVSRARQRAQFILPVGVAGYFQPIGQLELG